MTRNSFVRMGGAGALLCLVAAAACTDTVTSAPSAVAAGPSMSAGSYDGETLFRGVMLGQGPVADSIPEIAANFKASNLVTASMSATTLSSVQNRLVTQVNTLDPNFMGTFKSAMNSGDPYLIETYVDSAAVLLNEAVNWLAEGDTMRVYEDDPYLVDVRLQPIEDAYGNVNLGDTLVNSSSASGELTSRTYEFKPSRTVGGCTNPLERYCTDEDPMGAGDGGEVVPIGDPNDVDQTQGALRIYKVGLAVYWVAGVHVAVVYNAYVAIVWGKYVAIGTRRNWTAAQTSLLRDQIISSIATRLAV